MNRSTLISLILFLAGGGFLIVRAMTAEYGKVYVHESEVALQTDTGPITWTEINTVTPAQRNDDGVRFSTSRTIGLWAGALLTLCILSFLYGDNFVYKTAESIFVGVSAAYWMVAGFWNEIVKNLFGPLLPVLMSEWGLAGIGKPLDAIPVRWVALVLSIMMLWRLVPKGEWIARWPLALFIGATAGFRMLAYMDADFVTQIQGTIIPLVVNSADGGLDLRSTFVNIVIVVSVMSCLTYFFFSVEHKGVVRHVSRLGIAILMISFGASFAFTVMGRIALISQRVEFLFDDWLWLIDPLSRRAGM